MWRQLILSTAIIFAVLPTSLFSQTPIQIQAPDKVIPQAVIPGQSPDAVCNEAGTFKLGAFVGQSNDVDLLTPTDTIFLCLGDKIDVNHDGNYDISGDPQPASLGGATYAFYNCKPTVGGMTLAQIKTDPCLNKGGITPPVQGIWVSDMINLTEAMGDQTFTNDGNLQTFFGNGTSNPLLQWFAPITVDDWVAPGYEQINNVSPIGPCVDVNVAAAFPIVYLNAITVDDIDLAVDTNNCIANFRPLGGYSEWIERLPGNDRSLFTLSVTGPADVAIATKPTDIRDGGINPRLLFSQPGIYTVNIEDKKSCGLTFSLDMSGCVPTKNLQLIAPSQNFAVGTTICLPIKVENFNGITTLQGTTSWDPQKFKFISTQVGALGTDVTFNSGQAVSNGLLSFTWLDANLNPKTLADGSVIFSICLQSIGVSGSISPITFNSTLSNLESTDKFGKKLSITLKPGNLTIGQVAIAQVNVTSNCTSAGAFEVMATGTGTAGYMLAYQNTTFNTPIQTASFSNTFIASSLSVGNYSIKVTDSAGLIFDTTITIYQLPAAFDKTDPTCFGDKNGQAKVILKDLMGNVIPVPGPEFSFVWSPSGGPNAPIWNNISGGNYSVTVTNTQNGCTAFAAGTVNDPSQILITNLNKTDATCSGVANGTLSFKITGGKPPYLTDFDGGLASPFSGANYTNSAINAGVYHLTITDNVGCKRIDSIEINALKAYELAETITNVPCFGQNTGSISVIFSTNVGNPTPPLSFVWSSGTVSNAGFSSTSSNLSAATINLVAKDATGCGVTANYQVMQPTAALTSNLTKIDPTCTVPTSGSVCALMTSGGSLPYAFSWDNGGSTACINNLIGGTYCVTVTDNNGCTTSKCTTLQIPPSPIINSVDSTSVNCFDSVNGKLIVDAVAGSANSNIVSYVWSTGSTTKTASNLACGGPYNVTITDNNGCKMTGSYKLACPPQLLFVDTTLVMPTCPDDDNGSICVVISGGFSPYSYTWNPAGAPNNPCLQNKKKGIYNVTVKDAKNCQVFGVFEIKDPEAIEASFLNLTAATCAGTSNCNGSVDVTAEYPSGQLAAFTYQWIEANIFDQNPATLCPGTNTVQITDNATGCLIKSAIVISAPPPILIADIPPFPTTCNSICDGSAIAQVSGGVSPYIYAWSNGQTLSQATGLCAGPVVVTVTDANNCDTVHIFPLVVEPDPVQVLFDPVISSDVTCFGSSNGVIGWLATGGNGGFSWNWSPNVGNTQVVSNLAAGQYLVTATDALGCSGTGLANLQENPPIQASFDTYEAIKCFGESTNLSVDTVVGGVGPYTYELDFGPTTPTTLDTRVEGGDHIAIFIDQADCRDTVLITVVQPAEIGLELGADLKIELGDTLQQIFPQFNIQVDSFIWTPEIGLNSALDLRPFVNSFESQLYSLTIFDANGCSGTDELFVEIDPNRKVFIPNAFHPGSTLSDNFRIFVGNGVKSVNYMRIFDRWGELMYEQKKFFPSNGDYSEGWNGSFRGRKMLSGVYLYLVEVTFLDGRTLLYRGDVTLVRDNE